MQARDSLPHVEKIVRGILSEFKAEEKAEVESLLAHFAGWKGTFTEDSVASTIWSFW